MTQPFKIHSDYTPAGDQPTAIAQLVDGIRDGEQEQVLLGVTGSGKTFSMAHLIEQTQRPTLIMAHNKTLAAQLYSEMQSFFPNNAVEYFVSYYDYYQPEAYVPKSDTFIEKDASINEQIERMRHSATRSLVQRRDTIIVSSVSCIYGLGDLTTYQSMTLELTIDQSIDISDVSKKLVELQYKRNDLQFSRGTYRIRGDILEIFPSHLEDRAWRISFFGDDIEDMREFDPLTGEKVATLDTITVFPNSHYVTPRASIAGAIKNIKLELADRLEHFKKHDKLLEAQRLEERTRFDLEMMEATGFCSGIENYSRYLSGRPAGMAPPTLLEYLPDDALLIVDESHVTVPQIGGMYRGDFARKSNLSEFGFRLPSCMDNRPLKFEEWDSLRPQTVFVSATPGDWELKHTQGVFAEQVIRPTGLLDPVCIVRPTASQVDDLLAECRDTVAKGERVLVTTLTKKMAEDLTNYMVEAGLKVRYLHSDVDTLERIEILRDLRLGLFDILVGINLLREGLDIPECSLVAILDADKEGFLRSKTSLIQTIGRAARHVNGRAVLYADKITQSLDYAMGETNRRRTKQQNYNSQHGITPESVKREIHNLDNLYNKDHVTITKTKVEFGEFADIINKMTLDSYLKKVSQCMHKYAADLDFENAALLRDEIQTYENKDISMPLNSFDVNKKIVTMVFKK